MTSTKNKSSIRTSNTKLYKFKVGDIVESSSNTKKGSIGKVVDFDYSKSHFPLVVEFDSKPGDLFYFTVEGYYETSNDKPDIKLVNK